MEAQDNNKHNEKFYHSRSIVGEALSWHYVLSGDGCCLVVQFTDVLLSFVLVIVRFTVVKSETCQ